MTPVSNGNIYGVALILAKIEKQVLKTHLV